jgi:hypothetical protein
MATTVPTNGGFLWKAVIRGDLEVTPRADFQTLRPIRQCVMENTWDGVKELGPSIWSVGLLLFHRGLVPPGCNRRG